MVQNYKVDKKKHILFFILALFAALPIKSAVDYNGNRVRKGNGIVLTPQSIYYNGLLQSVTSPQLAGYLDLTFNAIGNVVLPAFTVENDDICSALQLQADGKLVLAGSSSLGGGVYRYTVARLNTNGALDSSFGTGGIVVLPTFGLIYDVCVALQLQADGKLVLAGSSGDGGVNRYSAARLNTSGTVDSSFGTGGTIVLPTFGVGNDDSCYALQLQADGKLVLAGYSSLVGGVLRYSVARLNTDGTLDNSFGTGGTFVLPTFGAGNQDICRALQVQPDGKLVLAGSSSLGGGVNRCSVARLNTNGTLDNSFGTGGIVVLPTFGVGNDDRCYALQLQADGKLVLAGYSDAGAGFSHYSAARLNTNGTLDSSFGTGGTVVLPTFGVVIEDICRALQIQADGKLVLAGYSNVGGPFYRYSAARLNTNGTLDSSFGTGGTVVLPMFGVVNNNKCYALRLQVDGKLVLAGSSSLGGGVNRYSAARLTNQSITVQEYETIYPGQGGFY